MTAAATQAAIASVGSMAPGPSSAALCVVSTAVSVSEIELHGSRTKNTTTVLGNAAFKRASLQTEDSSHATCETII